MRLRISIIAGATALGLSLGSAALVTAAQSAAVLAGESYGAYASTTLGSLARTPVAVLPGSGMEDAYLAGASVPGVLEVTALSSITTGDADLGDASAQSIATVGSLNILDGLITAEAVAAISSSYAGVSGVASDAEGTWFANLVVAGTPIAPEVAPNTRIDLPGVGYVVLNEQIPEGDGSASTGLRVNGIHVVLTEPTTGTETGEIVVASAHSAAAQ